MAGNKKKDGRIWLTGRNEIADAIGRSPRAIPKLVRDEDLPAFVFCGCWTATREDLAEWAGSMAQRYRPHKRKRRA